MPPKFLHLVRAVPPPPSAELSLSPCRIAALLREGQQLSDRAFDSLLPTALRASSSLHFTPLFVAVQAAKWIEELGISTVLDIGSGAGKFCVTAALASKSTRYVGLEQRARLVAASRDLARTLEVDHRVTFFQGTFGVGHLPSADAYYMYNPFGENLFGSDGQIDGDVELGLVRYQCDVALAERMLTKAPLGTYLLTYNGFGGVVPRSYSELRVDRELPNVLRMWQKTQLTETRGRRSEGGAHRLHPSTEPL